MRTTAILVERALRLSVSEEGDGQLGLNWISSEGYYRYRKLVKVEGGPVGSVEAGSLSPDVGANDAEGRALVRTPQGLGPPTLLPIGLDGKERRAQRIVGELSADAFLARLAHARKR